jgi:hypothetical protein
MTDLRDLGPYKIEKAIDYGLLEDRSLETIIKVKRSHPDPPFFPVESHLFKYSDRELGLYLKDRKNAWRDLSKILRIDIDIHEPEVILIFPVSMFKEIAKVIPFRKKRGSATMTDAQKHDRILRLKTSRNGMQKGSRLNDKSSCHILHPIKSDRTLDMFKEDGTF